MQSNLDATRQRQCERSFASFGIEWVCYVKPMARNGGVYEYAVHGADGTHLGQFPDREVAEAATRMHDMEPVSVH